MTPNAEREWEKEFDELIHMHNAIARYYGVKKLICAIEQAATEKAIRRAIEAIEKADPLEAPSHAWEDGPDEQLAYDVQEYLVSQLAMLTEVEK